MDVQTEGIELGRYRLGRLIGSGGMGDVYLARDAKLRRDVAIKFVGGAGPSSELLTRRLLQEAQAVAALDHPGICPVHDVGIDPLGRPYMVMQYVAGQTLAARLAQGPLPVVDTLRTCAQIADALAAAHRHGIIHRDLKPQNVMLTTSGQTKLLDFGIAKVLPVHDTAGADTTITSLTQPHAVVGTPAYMSPEQIQERPLDGRSDLFSLGCILFECLTGRRAFDARQTVEVLGQILHIHPPPPSTLRPELDERHDAVCRRLLEKDPDARFRSAEELVTALRDLQADGVAPGAPSHQAWRVASRGHWRGVVAALGIVLVGASAGLWQWTRPGLPRPPRAAARYYQLGTDALREGAAHGAAVALAEAVKLFPDYALAYARLAEAHTEMDDDDEAKGDLVRLSKVIPDASRLSREEHLRLDAIRSLVLGDPDAAVMAYRELAQRRQDDAGAWVDLARAQETAAQLADARASADRAVKVDPQYAAARLRLGIIEGFLGHKPAALTAFAEAQRLYHLSSNKEGEAEVLLRRGGLLNSAGDFDAARESIEQARSIARANENRFQIVRGDMLLGSVMASQSRGAEAEPLVSAAITEARNAGLETVAADGLVDLGGALVGRGRYKEAEAPLRTAIDLARKRSNQRAIARASAQLAFAQTAMGQPAEALMTLEPTLEFVKQHKYRNLELTALTIAARAYKDLDDLPKAREVGTRALKEAEATGDEQRLSLALNNLASQATALGSLPEALALRERAEVIHRRQRNTTLLPFDLTNRSELLIMLGRFEEASTALAEVEEGMAKKLEPYLTRRQRVVFLHVLSETLANRWAEADSLLRTMPADPPDSPAAILAPIVERYVKARQRHPLPVSEGVVRTTDGAVARERQYWLAATSLARGDARSALTTALAGVQAAAKINNDELAWRIAAVGSIAAARAGNVEQQRALEAIAVAARTRLRASWGASVTRYDQRPDLIELRKTSRLEE